MVDSVIFIEYDHRNCYHYAVLATYCISCQLGLSEQQDEAVPILGEAIDEELLQRAEGFVEVDEGEGGGSVE